MLMMSAIKPTTCSFFAKKANYFASMFDSFSKKMIHYTNLIVEEFAKIMGHGERPVDFSAIVMSNVTF